MGYEVVPFSIPTTKSLLGPFLIFFVRTKWYDAMAATWRRRRRPPFRPRSRLRAAPGSRRASPTLLARPPSGMLRSFEWHSIVQVDQVPQRSFRGLLMSKCTAHAYSLLAACIFSLILCFCFALACAQFSSTPASAWYVWIRCGGLGHATVVPVVSVDRAYVCGSRLWQARRPEVRLQRLLLLLPAVQRGEGETRASIASFVRAGARALQKPTSVSAGTTSTTFVPIVPFYAPLQKPGLTPSVKC